MAALNYLGVALVLMLIIGVGIYSGRKVKSAADFATGGGKVGPWMISGTIMGALVSSQASIGTAQLAFSYGVSAWWFTLGSGLGCLILALGYVRPLRRSGCTTLMAVIDGEYGHRVEYAGSVLSSIGIFISVLAQVVSCTGLITVIFPVSTVVAAALSVLLMTVYVVFGGAWGAGMGGIVKLVLLYAACIAALAAVLVLSGGLNGLRDDLQSALVGTAQGAAAGIKSLKDMSARYGSLVARGVAKDIGSGLSLLLGVLSTQTYAQAIWSGHSDRTARRGALQAAVLIPPIGIAGIAVGLFMRSHYITQAEADALLSSGQALPGGMGVLTSTIQVFPTFVVNHMPVLFAGVVLGTLLITVVGGGAGLSLGVATIMVNDIYKKISARFESTAMALFATRGTILAVLAVSAIIACIVPSATINDFGFLSMGLRGAVVFIPLTCALFLPGRIDWQFALLSTLGGPLGVLLGKLLKVGVDPLFIGMGVSLFMACLGCVMGDRKRRALANSREK
ncbi:sodium:solute symporter family protein [Flavonifractor sp. DFI.6.63]|uniref:sodium:solute symporter family protein n=1 Tax=Flavonifractor sp. DFI.6.63 TaxID=2963704 RepID=UPI00210A24DB|nr:sodium:solute symporter family protein [Flavonifractor sp. DFI.6.63]MCQ5029631.1 sodium:solute symporter family protein [Flavonifractor sp. DFI.6.63]